jgi:hypothetical protein
MAVEIDLLMQIANSLFTFGCGIILLALVHQGRLERNLFYFGWAIGFFLYGTQIFLRIFSTAIYFQIPMVLAFLFFFPFSMLVLSSRKNLFILLPIGFLVAILFLSFSYVGGLHYSELFWVISSAIFYLPVTAVVLIHRKLFGSSVDKLLIGWLSLFVINAFFPMVGWITDTLAIFCKIVLLSGIMSYDFAILTLKVRSGLSSGVLSPLADYGESRQIELVVLRSNQDPPIKTLSVWLKNRVNKNIKEKIDTSLLILHDTIPYEILRSIAWIKPEMVHIFIFSHECSSNTEFTNLKYGMIEIGAAISEIAKKESKPENSKEIILVDLSILIHTFGTKEAYNLLLNKIGLLRSSYTSLAMPFHTKTHEDQVIALFKTLATKITQL